MAKLPPFPYGAVYFRKSNPPREDWARDYQVAAEDGMNVFRHWFLWSAIETAPDVFDWADYDAQLDLAARFGLKTIIAEFITAAPEWESKAATTDGTAARRRKHVSRVDWGDRSSARTPSPSPISRGVRSCIRSS